MIMAETIFESGSERMGALLFLKDRRFSAVCCGELQFCRPERTWVPITDIDSI
jgi:hypothetical protein